MRDSCFSSGALLEWNLMLSGVEDLANRYIATERSNFTLTRPQALSLKAHWFRNNCTEVFRNLQGLLNT